MSIPTLTQMLNKHRAEGRLSWLPRLSGEIFATLRDEDGRIVQQLRQKNLMTRTYWEFRTRYDYQINTVSICISNDDDVMNFRKTIFRNTYTDTGSLTSNTIEVNNTSKTWTFRGTFGAPSTDNTIYWVGLATNFAVLTSGDFNIKYQCYCGTKLSSSFVQTTSQTLELVYRISLTQV